MIKKTLLSVFLFLFSYSYTQGKVTSKEVESAFHLIFQDPEAAFKKLRVLQEQTHQQKDSLNAIVLGHIGVYYAVKSDFNKAAYYFDLAIKNGVKGSKSYVNSQKNRAIIHKKVGETDTAIRLLKQALVLANQNKYSDTAAIIYGELGSCYSASEDYENALYYLIKSIELWEQIEPKDQKKIVVEKQKLANLYFKMDNSKYALQLYDEIIPVFKSNADFYNYYLSQITVASIYLHIKQPTKALTLLDEALVYLKKIDNVELILYARERRAKALQLLNRIPDAKKAYQAAFNYGLQHNQLRTVYTFIEMGNLFLSEGMLSDFQVYVKDSETLAFHKLFDLTTTEDQKRYYELMLAYYEKNGGASEKIAFFKKMILQKEEELKAKFNVNSVREKQAEYRSVLAEKEATIAAQKLEFERAKLIVLIFLVLLFLVLGISLYSRFQMKQRLLKSELDNTILEKLLIEKAFKKEKALNVDHVQKIKLQEQEILTQTLQKAESDTLIDQVVSDLTTVAPVSTIKSIKTLRNGGTHYWKSVLEKFDKINPDFNQFLVTHYPQLTKGDRDFCSFVKLNLSNKEIAHLLQISPESVITKKYRIVKKIDLPKEVDFQQWLSEIG